MKLSRRAFLHLGGGVVALPMVSRTAWAQPYPSRPVRIIVGFAAGGSTDILARLMGQWLSDRLGQPFLIENRTGASGNIATEAVVKASADGYTLLMTGSTDAVNASLYTNLNFNFVRDIAPVASVMRTPLLMVVNPSVPVRTVPELIAYAKVNPRKLNMGSGGIGTPPHVAGELFKMLTGADMLHVPYRGGAPAVADLLSGQLQVMFAIMPEAIEHVKAGKLRPLAVTSAIRFPALPGLPAVAEFVPGYETSYWVGVGVPKNTAAGVIDTLNREINSALADSKIVARLAELEAAALPGSPADFGKLIVDETEKWANVIKVAGIKRE
jgi:tripartite-type tricarboxylate transporter receptor subunit TctC